MGIVVKRALSSALVWALAGCGGEESPPEPTPTETTVAENTEPEVETPEVEPEVEPTPIELIDLVHRVPVTVAADSAYHGQLNQVERLYDGDLTTAWNSESNEGTAVLTFLFERPTELHAVAMTSGYTKTDGDRDLFAGNRRINSIEIVVDGESKKRAPLDPDSRELQTVTLDEPVAGQRVEVRLAGFSPGTNADWRELCVSELRLMGVDASASAEPLTPTSHLGPVVPTDTRAFLTSTYADYLTSSGDEQPMPSGVAEVATGMGTLNTRDARETFRASAGKCYLVVGEMSFYPRERDELVGVYPPDLVVLVGEEDDQNALDGEDPTFLLGTGSACAETSGRATITFTAQAMPAAYWYSVYEFADPVLAGLGADALEEDPDALGEDEMPDEDALEPMESETGIVLSETALGTGVESRALVGARTTFSKATDERVYCFTRLDNPNRVESQLYFGWERGGEPVDSADSSDWGRANSVPANRHHGTFTYRGTGQRAGEYACVIRDEDGVVLARLPYTLTD